MLLIPSGRRDRVRQIVSNDKRFQCGEWKDLWETGRFVRKETDNSPKRNQTRTKRYTSIQGRVVYVEHYTRWGSRSKVNQTIASDLLVNSESLTL